MNQLEREIASAPSFHAAISGVTGQLADQASARFDGLGGGHHDILDAHVTIQQLESEIALIGRRLADYVEAEGVTDLFFVDLSSRPAYVVFSEAWKDSVRSTSKPTVRFINPVGFMTASDILTDQHIKAKFDTSHASDARSRDIIQEEVRCYLNAYPLGPKPLLFDTCVHSGKVLRPVIQAFSDENVHLRFATAAGFSDRLGLHPDVEMIAFDPVLHCVPFGVETTCTKGLGSIIVSPNKDSSPRETAQSRRALKHLTQDALRRY